VPWARGRHCGYDCRLGFDVDSVIRVLIADDHEVVRQGLAFVLGQEPGVEVVGEAADGNAAVAAVHRLRPDVVLLDMLMPGLDGLGVLLALSVLPRRPAVVVLTSYDDEARAMEAVRAGALSYLPKTASTDRVVEAVRAAADGGSVLDPGIAAALIRRVRATAGEGPLERLSTRERDVLAELSRGRSNREIARLLRLGEQTVKSYVSSILTKLNLQDRTQAAIFGLQHGVVPLGDALDQPPHPPGGDAR
jgi:NarL family two-component system response regulator LiaR